MQVPMLHGVRKEIAVSPELYGEKVTGRIVVGSDRKIQIPLMAFQYIDRGFRTYTWLRWYVVEGFNRIDLQHEQENAVKYFPPFGHKGGVGLCHERIGRFSNSLSVYLRNGDDGGIAYAQELANKTTANFKVANGDMLFDLDRETSRMADELAATKEVGTV